MQAVMWIEPAVAILQHKKRGYLQQPEQVDRSPPRHCATPSSADLHLRTVTLRRPARELSECCWEKCSDSSAHRAPQAYADALSKKGFLRLRAAGSGTSYVFAVGKIAQAGRLIRPLTFSLRCAELCPLPVFNDTYRTGPITTTP